MLDIIRRNKLFFLAVTLAGIVLRLLFILRFPGVTSDSFVYGDIAKNWLQHGIYGVTAAGAVVPTYIRLPGYPAFVAAIFAIFGLDHYRAVLIVQMLIDIGTCLLIANLARRVLNPRAARVAFLLAALCPFLANYAGAALTESLEIFFTALSLNFAVIALEAQERGGLRAWIGCGIATAATMLLRPDGGILLFAILLFLAWSATRERKAAPYAIRAAFIVAAISIAPLIPWTLRNLHTMHRFQPLAPRYANEEGEFVPMGFNRWVKTWIADYASVEEIYWPIPGDAVDPAKLPDRAFDSPQQREETAQLLDDYDGDSQLNPALDAKFADLASQRIHHAPLRYYLWLPALRIADMWLRPRTEMLPSDTRWWEFNDDPEWSVLAVSLGLIGIFYVGSALFGLTRAKSLKHLGLLLTFVIVRSLFLGTLENPEPRYVLECFPVVIVLAAAAFQPR